jgi:glycosyltransferase involved in cell wall biosynthesis
LRSAPGLCGQRNIGAEHATGNIIFFIDDDIVLQNNFAEKIIEVYSLKKNQNIGGVRGSLIEYFNEGWISRTFRRIFFMTRGSIREKSRFLPSLGYVYIFMPGEIIEVEAMQTAVCSFYKTVFDEFKFDEAFPRCNDLDISYRVSRKYKLYQTPYALAHHNHSYNTHPNVKKLNELYVVFSHKLAKKYISKYNIKWLAYYWSILGEIILSTIKSIKSLNPDYIIGDLSGIKHLILHRKEEIRNEKTYK